VERPLRALCSAFLLASACGAGTASLTAAGTISREDWLGAWTCTQSTPTGCPTLAPATDVQTDTFAAQGDAGITYTTPGGCVCNFSLSGNSASQVDAPAQCGWGDTRSSITDYTLTCDGGSLSGQFEGTLYGLDSGICVQTVTVNCVR
jgi:hypothetical protein